MQNLLGSIGTNNMEFKSNFTKIGRNFGKDTKKSEKTET